MSVNTIAASLRCAVVSEGIRFSGPGPALPEFRFELAVHPLLLRQEFYEALFLTKVLQVGIGCEQLIARKAVIGGLFKICQSWLALVQQGISQSDVVKRVVEMSEPLAL